MKLLVIYNPMAGNGRAKKLLPAICQYLKLQSLDAEVIQTTHMGHATEIVANAKLSLFDAVISSGGDGTTFEVVNGYFKNPEKNKPPIGIIPNGTGNAFLKELKLVKGHWRQAIDIIAQGHARMIDVSRFKTQDQFFYNINIVGMGFVTDVAEAAIHLKWMGNSAYTAATLQKLINLKARDITLEIDGQVHHKKAVFVMVSNSTFTGTSFLIAPKAKLDDGLLDIILLNDISRLRLLRLFTSIYDGSHIHYPEIEYYQGRVIKITETSQTLPPSRLIPDGEVLGETPVEFECLPKALPFLWDKKLIPSN